MQHTIAYVHLNLFLLCLISQHFLTLLHNPKRSAVCMLVCMQILLLSGQRCLIYHKALLEALMYENFEYILTWRNLAPAAGR